MTERGRGGELPAERWWADGLERGGGVECSAARGFGHEESTAHRGAVDGVYAMHHGCRWSRVSSLSVDVRVSWCFGRVVRGSLVWQSNQGLSKESVLNLIGYLASEVISVL